MRSAKLLSSEDCPKRQSLYASGIEREALSVHQLLSRGIDHGLQCDSEDPAKAASDEVMRLCISRPIDTDNTNLLDIAESTAALAEIITYCLRTGSAWQHPKPLKIGEHIWHPSCFAIPGGLRRVVLCDHWGERRALQEARAWETLEGALYGLPVTIIAVCLGAMREGRRHGPLSKGWLHPRSGELRFRKRDGTGFDGAWIPVFRDSYDGTREEWVEAMSADGVMLDTFVVHPAVEFEPDISAGIRLLAQSKLDQVHANVPEGVPHQSGEKIDSKEASEGAKGKVHCLCTIPQRNLSRCFDSIHPCEFRFPCAYFKEPEIGKGFISVPWPRTSEAEIHNSISDCALVFRRG